MVGETIVIAFAGIFSGFIILFCFLYICGGLCILHRTRIHPELPDSPPPPQEPQIVPPESHVIIVQPDSHIALAKEISSD
jgi:hypothetical protein